MVIRTQTGATVILNLDDGVVFDLQKTASDVWEVFGKKGPFQYCLYRVPDQTNALIFSA